MAASKDDMASDTGQTTKEKPIQLRFDGAVPVVVTPQDQDRFVMMMEDAVKACRAYDRSMKWRQEFDKFTSQINSWCLAHAAKVSASYVEIREFGLAVFIVGKLPYFDFAFDEEVGDFAASLRRSYASVPAQVMQLPNGTAEHLSAFVNTSKALQTYASGSSAPSKG